MHPRSPQRYLVAATFVAAALSACSNERAPISGPALSPVPWAHELSSTEVPSDDPSKKVVVCKEGPTGSYSFTVSAVGGTPVFPSGTSFTVAAGECKDAWMAAETADQLDPVTVTVTETGTEPLDSIIRAPDYTSADKLTGTRTVSVIVNHDHGAILTYFNAFPPPPPPGVEGCTPGYWKQSQHFGNWTLPYVPTGAGATDFDAAFGVDAFNPNITLLTALGRQGGGLSALARHAAAALLNAASANVDYSLSIAQVIELVQGAIASGDYETAQELLMTQNELGCGLERAELP